MEGGAGKFGHGPRRRQSQGSRRDLPKGIRASLAVASESPHFPAGVKAASLGICSLLAHASCRSQTTPGACPSLAFSHPGLNCFASCLNDLPVSSLPHVPLPLTLPQGNLPPHEDNQVTLSKKALECPHVACRI